MLRSSILSLICVSIAAASPSASVKTHLGGQLLARQSVCNPSDQPVSACGSAHLSKANWAAFGIDDFLVNFIFVFGTGVVSTDLGFPGFFVQQNLVPGADFLFDCSIIGSTLCSHPAQTNPTVEDDCAFRDIPNIDSAACGKYITPQAGFVVENFIRFHKSVSNNFLAIEDAGNAILNSNFISDVVDGLSEEQGSILDAVFGAIAGFVIGILPFGRAFTLGVELFKGLDRLYSLAGQDSVLSSPLDIVNTISANNAIQDLAERTKDQLRRQVEQMVASSQAQMQEALDIMFGTGPKSVAGQSGTDAQDSFAFQLAQNGAFLDTVPSREDLAVVMESNLKNWIVSSTMTGMDWNVLLDPTLLEDDPADPGGVCRKGIKGIPGVLGAVCADFRRGGFGGTKPENPAVLESLIDVEDMIRNAQECNGNSPIWRGIIDGSDTSRTTLPRCMYKFSVLSIADRVTDGI
ncbi:hypothetical protein PV04_01408 [Phialophora macrospora]|uniref:Uncharacterized protein n=1 Tax=Phialophora macrospora TaxID=1851006 RepID=A0A0D2D6S9_9EURO|nr:hypothetical protein PV04_01408 [Phialophora macrospora]